MSNEKEKLEVIVNLIAGDLEHIHEQVCYRESDFGGNAWTAASVNTAYNICMWKEDIFKVVGDPERLGDWSTKLAEIGAVMVKLAKREGGAA